MKEYKVEHFHKNKSFIIKAEDEASAWDYFLDHKLPLSEMPEDYFITLKGES